MSKPKETILFTCTGNSCRSQVLALAGNLPLAAFLMISVFFIIILF